MSSKPRYCKPGALVEVTSRTILGQFLLTPSAEFNEGLTGLLGRLLERYDVKLHAIATMSNHYHLLATVADVDHLIGFERDLNSGIARHVGRLCGGDRRVWSRPYQDVAVLDEAAAEARIRYFFDQATRHDLVERPRDWPGVHSLDALCRGETLAGIWTCHDDLTRAERAGKNTDHARIRYEVPHHPLPQWVRLSQPALRARYRAIEHDIERSARERRRTTGAKVIGAARILAQSRYHLPETVARSPAPPCHTTNPSLRAEYIDAYRSFIAAQREATARLIAAIATFRFPDQGALPWMPPRALPAPQPSG